MFSISPQEASVARRGFHTWDEGQRLKTEKVGTTFLEGYHSAIEEPHIEQLVLRLNAVEGEYRGFAFEGAGMGLAILDLLTPWNRGRIDSFLSGSAAAHIYMVHVGIGWAFARIPFGMKSSFKRLDPLLRWLAIDGYGFHQGYFHWPRYVRERKRPERFKGYSARAFDQGIGRSLWFVEGADVNRIAATVSTFDTARHPDLWSGIGLACAYAGSLDRQRIETLRDSAGPHKSNLAQGAAFAAKARQRAGNPANHTELACQVLCRASADAAARITDLTLERLPCDEEVPAYEIWRRRIEADLEKETSVI